MKNNKNSIIYAFCEKNKFLKWVFLFLFILTIGIHFYLSLENANESSELSSSVSEQIVEVVEEITGSEINHETAHSVIRKLVGHFMWFCLIGVLGYLTFTSFMGNKYYLSILLYCFFGIIVAVFSEVLQLLGEGRSCEFKDMLIDFSGYLIFGIIFYIVHLFVNNKEMSMA